MPPNQADGNLERWVLEHGLPWNDAIQKFFFGQGVEVVEHIKVIKRSLFLKQFEGEKPVKQALAKIAWDELGGMETFSFGRAATTSHFKDFTSLPAAPSPTAPSPAAV